jgi:hypothetical protein
MHIFKFDLDFSLWSMVQKNVVAHNASLHRNVFASQMMLVVWALET